MFGCAVTGKAVVVAIGQKVEKVGQSGWALPGLRGYSPGKVGKESSGSRYFCTTQDRR